MALKAGRVGVAPDQVDDFGKVKSEATSGYTKQEADAKFETQTAAAAALAGKQPIQLSVPIEMLQGSVLTVEEALNTLNTEVTPVGGSITYEEGVRQNAPDAVPLSKFLEICFITIDLLGVVGNTSTWIKLGTLPAGYRPKSNTPLTCWINAKSDVCDCEARSDGELRIRNNTNALTATDIIHINSNYII